MFDVFTGFGVWIMWVEAYSQLLCIYKKPFQMWFYKGIVNLLILLSLKSSLRLELYVAYMWLCNYCVMVQLDSDFEEIFQRLKSENRWPELSDDFLRALLEVIIITLHLHSVFCCIAVDFLYLAFSNWSHALVALPFSLIWKLPKFIRPCVDVQEGIHGPLLSVSVKRFLF